MKILILALFFIILIGIGIFFKNSGLFKNPLREGVAPLAIYTVGAPSPANSDLAPDGKCIAQNSYIGTDGTLTNCDGDDINAKCEAATDLDGCDKAVGGDNKCCFWKSGPVVDCSGSWTACSNTCGPGVQTYEITQPWRQGGASCPYNKNETRVCDGTIGCKDKKDCVGSWGECIARDPTKKCGPGIQTYTLSVPATAGGEICPHATGDTQSCFEAECIDEKTVPVNCEGRWNDCSASCGPGFGIQRYVITKPSAYGGNPCAHNQNDSQVCNRPECPADCESSWGPPCPTKCGIVQEQTYTITTPQAYGGAQCNPQHTVGDTRKCPVIKCPLKCDGTWGICDSSCSIKNGSDSELSGTQTFTITQPAVAGGGKCSDISNALYMPVGGEGKGCAGAITSDGLPSSYYCEGGGSSGTEFEWLSECCMWDRNTTSCKPKDVGTPEDDEAQEKSDKTFIANNNLNCPEKKTKVCKTSCPKCDKQGQYLAINDASCPGLDWTQATDFTGGGGGSYDVSNSCCMNCPNGQTTKPREDGSSNLIGDCYYDKACDNPVGTECLTNGFCKKYSSSTDAMKTGCKKYCNNGYYISNRVGNTTCNEITKPHECEGSDVLINDNNGYAKFKYVDATFQPSSPPIKCNSNQYCIATSDTSGVCQNKYGNVGACTGNISLNESNECNNGRKWLGKYTSDTGKFGIGCETTVRNIFSDHGIKADTFEYNANGSVFIGSGNCQMDCSGYWFNNPSCNDGYITHSFITDPNTPKNNGITCLEQAKRSFDYNKDASEFIVMGIPHTASINDIKEDENGNISIKKACHIDCSGVWPDFSATTCPTSSAGVDANTLSRTFAIANQPQYIGANSCYDLAVDLSSNPFPHTTSSITQDGDNIIQKVFCSQDCIGEWDKAADATCNNGTIPLTWKTTSESINGGKTCDIVAKSTYGNEYNYTQDSIQTTSWIGPVQCGGGGIDKWDCTTNISCPVDCSYTISPWSACTKGKRSSIVKIHDYGRNDGAKCPYRDKTEIWENCTMPFPLPVQTPDEYITELPCKLDNRPGTEKCSDKCVPYLPPYCENINQGVDENGNPVNGICCPFYDPDAKVNCQSCGTVKYNDASKEIQSNIIKMHDNDTSGIPEWEKQLSNLSQNSQNVLSDILGKIF